MAGSNDEERVHPETAHGLSANAAPPRKTAHAVQTPPPQTEVARQFDSEAPTVLHQEAGDEAATPIDLRHSSEAPTVLETPARVPSRPMSKAPASNWSAAFLLPSGSVLAGRYEILEML